MRAAENLEGLDLPGGWHVEKIADKSPMSTGGYSCVGYKVSNKAGKIAFLKALDFSVALQNTDPAHALEYLTKAYNFERNILQQCKDKKLRRVVVPLADGTAKVEGNFGPLENVPYLIFEMATGDIRSEVARWKKFDIAWALRSLHQSAVGLQELHGIGVAHQDVKPSNVLVFKDEGSKLGDLGSASQAGNPSLADRAQIPGDPGYATPEQMYGWGQSDDFSYRFIADLYRLGSLIFFFFAYCSANDALQLKMSIKHGKKFERSDFRSDLPYMQHAFAEALSDLRISLKGISEGISEEISDDTVDEIIMIAEQLCEPDPSRRGDTKAMAAAYRKQYDIQAFISRFDRLAMTAEKKII